MLNMIRGLWYMKSTTFLVKITPFHIILYFALFFLTGASLMTSIILSLWVTLVILVSLLVMRHIHVHYSTVRYRMKGLKQSRKALIHAVETYEIQIDEEVIIRPSDHTGFTYMQRMCNGYVVHYVESRESVYNAETMRNVHIPMYRMYAIFYYPRIVASSLILPEHYEESTVNGKRVNYVRFAREKLFELSDHAAPNTDELKELKERISDATIIDRRSAN